MFDQKNPEQEVPPALAALVPPQLGGFGSRPVAATEVVRDKSGAQTGTKPGEERAEYFQTARMANDPAMATANAQPTDAMAQAGAIPQLLEAQKQAREGGKHTEYQAKRAKFEHEVGLLAAEDPKALGTMQSMCDKAKDWIAVVGGGDAAYASLAQDASSGYGGAVGMGTEGVSPEEAEQRKKANADMMKTIMSGGGNIREMAMALQNFQTMMAKDLMDPTQGPDGLTKRQRFEAEQAKRKAAEEAAKAGPEGQAAGKSADAVAADAKKGAASMSSADMDKMLDRFDDTGAGKQSKAGDAAKAMFSPTKEEKSEGGRHEQFGAAKKEEHDTKLPPMPAEAAGAARTQQAAQDAVDRATVRITTLTGQRGAAEQAAAAADRQVADLEARAGSAPDAQKAAVQQQLTSARSSLVAKHRELSRIDGEIARAKSELDAARSQLSQSKTQAAQPPGAAGGAGGATKAGEKSPLAWSTEKVQEKKEVQPDGTEKTVHVSETGIKLSENEAAAMKRGHNPNGPNTLPMIEGQKANIVDANAEFISDANAADMPLKSGISGTTFRFMEMAELMGQPPENARLAMIGHLTPIGAHSIHEINTAASGFGDKDAAGEKPKEGEKAKESAVAYDAAKPNAEGGPYTPAKMKPLTAEQLSQCAMKAGFASLEEANTPPPDVDPAAPVKPSKAA